jgi:16S rRNA (guanine527-N7)-methyltransferase
MSADSRTPPTEEQISCSLSHFHVQPSNEQIVKIREYIRLLWKWNQSISLTSIVDPAEIIARHFGESIFACSLIPVENKRLADVGSGAGFPGLAMKIICPSLHVILIESNKKKCAFLSEIIRALDLTGVEVLPMRFEEMRVTSGFVEIVAARALGGFPGLLRWARTALAPRGHAILWVGGEDAGKISSTAGWIWQLPVRIPESKRRFVLIGRPSWDKIDKSDS